MIRNWLTLLTLLLSVFLGLLAPPVVGQTPPAAPMVLNAIAGDTYVSLSWSASAGADYYSVLRSTIPGGPYYEDYVYPRNAYETRYVDSGDGFDDPYNGPGLIPLQNGVTYYYVVVAENATGRSGYSNEASATPMPPPPPDAPTGLTATSGDSQVSLSWNASAGTSYGYHVKRATNIGGPFSIVGSTDATSYTDAGLTSGTIYYYVVSANNSGGESSNSNEASARPVLPPSPAAPTNLSATAAKGKVNLKWTRSSTSGVTQNRIYRATTNGGPYSLRATLSVGTSYTDSSVTTGITYYYVVTALKSGQESANSNQATAKAR